MPYVPGSQYDLFVSYAHVDNEPGPDGRGWVTDFHNCLIRTIRQKLGQGADDLKIFFDPVLQANQQLPELLAAAGDSAIFLAIGSPSWVTREFCKQELAAFAQSTPDTSRLFLAEYMSLGGDLTYPPQVQQHLRLEFHNSRGSIGQTRMPLDATNETDKPLYFERIHRLADQIVERMRTMRKAGAAPAAAPSAVGGASSGITALIAEPTDDLEDAAAQLGAYLEQYGIRPLFAPKNYFGTEEFAAQFVAMLGAADLFVQLLGPYGGKKPPGLPQGFTAFQAEEAAKSGKTVLQWRRPDLDLSQVAEPHRQLLDGADVVSSSFEDFKARVKDRAIELQKKAEAPPPKKSTSSSQLVFIDADPKDIDIAESLGMELQAQGMFCMLPSTSEGAAERMEELEENLLDCDVLVCLYGSAQPRWVHAQLRMLAKINPKRASELQVLAVCTGPPHPKEPLRAMFPGLRELQCGANHWDMKPIHELIGELQQ